MKILVVIAVAVAATFIIGLTMPLSEDQKFESLANDYIEKLLETNPETATRLGDHRYDHRLNDYTLAGIKKNLDLSRRYLDQLSTVNPSKLNEVNRIDYAILRANIQAAIYRLDVLKEYEWNPLNYIMGDSIYGLTAREFAPLKERLLSAQDRLRGIPAVLDAARLNLKNAPKIHVETAMLQNKGAIRMVRDELPADLERAPELKQDFAPVQAQAVAALTAFGNWLEKDLLPKATADFRIGDEKFRKKLFYTLDSDLSKEEVLHRAMADLRATQDAMFETALPIYSGYAKDSPDKKTVIQSVLNKLAEKHPTNDTIVELARQDLKTATDFVQRNRLVSLPREPLKIIVMPEFRRGIAVAYCDSPGPLEINGETFYAISPTPADWGVQRVASYFREYNDYMLLDMTVHEAMPGHYLQLAHSNQFRAPTKVRAVFRSGPFVEGWGSYAEKLMVERGFGGPEVKMQQLKMRLRLIINAILDQKIHTAGMTEKEAMDLMMNQGYQEEGEAAGKWRRACLTSTQLSTYFVGTTELDDIRKAYEARHGGIHDWKAFHDKLLSFGSPPPKYVRVLMGL